MRFVIVLRYIVNDSRDHLEYHRDIHGAASRTPVYSGEVEGKLQIPKGAHESVSAGFEGIHCYVSSWDMPEGKGGASKKMCADTKDPAKDLVCQFHTCKLRNCPRETILKYDYHNYHNYHKVSETASEKDFGVIVCVIVLFERLSHKVERTWLLKMSKIDSLWFLTRESKKLLQA